MENVLCSVLGTDMVREGDRTGTLTLPDAEAMKLMVLVMMLLLEVGRSVTVVLLLLLLLMDAELLMVLLLGVDGVLLLLVVRRAPVKASLRTPHCGENWYSPVPSTMSWTP